MIGRALALLLVVGLAVGGTAVGGAPALAASPAGPADTSACPSYNPPNELILDSGTPQSARLDTPFATTLQVSFDNSDGCPVTTSPAGIPVTFTAPSTGPSGTFSASGSNAVLVGANSAGEATASQFTANTLVGGYLVVASSELGSVSFSLVNTASGVAATIATVGPARQSATVSNRYGHPLQARVLDANGAPVAGAAVTFQLGSGVTGGAASASGSAGAAFQGGGSQANEQTDASGVATSPPFVANGAPGRYTATAMTPGSNSAATFALENLAAKPPRITVVGSERRSATAGHHYTRPLAVEVRTAQGAPLQGVTVTFTLGSGGNGGAQAPSGSGSGSAGASFAGGSVQATETTDARGRAVSPELTANTTPGSFNAVVSVAGGNAAAAFQLDNLAAKPPTIAALQHASRSATVGDRYPEPLRVKVLEAGKPVQAASVTFTLGSGATGGAAGNGSAGASPGAAFAGGSNQVTELTDAAGIATSPRFSANTTAGRFTATATTSGTTQTAAFQLDNLAGTPSTLVAGAAASESTTVGSPFPIRLAVTVTDAEDNPVAGVLVSFSAPSSGPGGSFAGTSRTVKVKTGATGVAVAPVLVADRVEGGFVVRATAAGRTAAFGLVNQPASP
jgi:adhesin/invasin